MAKQIELTVVSGFDSRGEPVSINLTNEEDSTGPIDMTGFFNRSLLTIIHGEDGVTTCTDYAQTLTSIGMRHQKPVELKVGDRARTFSRIGGGVVTVVRTRVTVVG